MTTEVTMVDMAGILNVVMAVLLGASVDVAEEEEAITTLKPQGVEMPSGRLCGIVIVLVGVQTDEGDLTTKLTPQGADIPVGRLIGIVIVVEGVHKVLEEEDEEPVTILTKQGTESPEGS